MVEYSSDLDARLMAAAIRLGARELGRTWPNPAVGALIVRHEAAGPVIIGRGWTRKGGRPHAETEALAQAGDRARGATCYVSLEPCSHHGRTSPCSDALIAAGVTRVVSAVEDPDARVSGHGHAALRDAGIDVVVGIGADEARAVHVGHFTRVREGRPWVTLKLAVSRDGMIAGPGGVPVAITGPRARASAHMLRATNDAILIGIRTALADDPALTCRLPGMQDRSPVRIVLDTDLRLPVTAKMLDEAGGTPVWLMSRETADPARRAGLERRGAVLLPSDGGIGAALDVLAEHGITRVLVEGGATVATSLADAGMIDEAVIYDGAVDIGANGVPAGPALAAIRANGAYRPVDRVSLGDDVMSTYIRTG
ncbi:bifunctional diaminohydroxyphosphoribosylaminopyrimidine deaminase/5-amino-6-(5-phosphoribosylamino)uracil reductase RibD [Microbaculum marinisediminis]|uniref:Riboflavin biosynthesis protein RibD n=1 Tax=Microbaculum marinisediminis TaxID=2931392 RepID=A0AAW5QYN2_9HYPH|nr:bifunctional diaminohydroxyphosphoribosylaminopyrimidine deaminase/5-amino-6-(5-phosphoribosylamino)uracil reductase RibD [Microbaculum sp. A6E488]MCT8973037.1 bifunctional diaminohydroxyphosphoribosylaminopyrimidine deaminase/5-amino-6-(5-phosphoribosylamino)uracil reductase RibD [Microbaculum sp. A6E488]